MKYRRHLNQSEVNDETMDLRDEDVIQNQTEECNKTKIKSAAKACNELQLNPSYSRSSNCISEELLNEEEQNQVSMNSESLDRRSNRSTQLMSTTGNRMFTKPVNAILVN